MGGLGSGGHNAASATVHRLRGTYRADRHAPTQAAPGDGWRPSTADLSALEAAGRRLVDDVMTEFELGAVEGHVLLAAARATDQLARLRAAGPGERPAARALRQWSSLLLAHLRTLQASVRR